MAEQIRTLAQSLANTASDLGTPANSSITQVEAGTFWWDANYFYIAVSDNLTKRVPLSTF